MFTHDTRTENFLRQLGCKFEYHEAVSIVEFSDDWKTQNKGRPESSPRVEAAVASYAEQMEGGSAAPAVIIRKSRSGWRVLDGVQRSLAAELNGYGSVAAYVVECNEKTAAKIRLAANCWFTSKAPVSQDWTVGELIREFVFNGDDTAKDIAAVAGVSVSRVEKIAGRMQAKQWAAGLYENGQAPPLSETVFDRIAENSRADDWEMAPKPLKSFLDTLVACSFANGESTQYVQQFFGIKRIGNKKRETQFKSKLQTMRQDPIVQGRLAGSKKQDGATKIDTAMKRLETVCKQHKKSKEKLTDRQLVEAWNRRWQEIGRVLREQVSQDVRNSVEPFVYVR